MLVREDLEDVEAGAAIGLHQRLALQSVGLSRKQILQRPVDAGDVLIEALHHKDDNFLVTRLRILNSMAFSHDRLRRVSELTCSGS